MASGRKGKAGGGARKVGRMKDRAPSKKRYDLENRFLRNKAKKLRRHIRRFEHDEQAKRALQSLIDRAPINLATVH